MAKLSAREKRAKALGMTLKQYLKTNEGKALAVVSKDAKYQGKQIDKKYHTDIDRLKEDFNNVLKAAGIETNRTTEDWTRNMQNLAENKAADTEDMNYYVNTERSRNQEDLDTSLYKEARRYELDTLRNSESLASRNLVYSNMGGQQGGIAGGEKRDLAITNKDTQKDLNVKAQRSFEDIARYEYSKSRDITMKYNRDTNESTIAKNRGLEDINIGVDNKRIANQRDIWDTKFNNKADVYDLNKRKANTMGSLFDKADKNYLDGNYSAKFNNILGQ